MGINEAGARSARLGVALLIILTASVALPSSPSVAQESSNEGRVSSSAPPNGSVESGDVVPLKRGGLSEHSIERPFSSVGDVVVELPARYPHRIREAQTLRALDHLSASTGTRL